MLNIKLAEKHTDIPIEVKEKLEKNLTALTYLLFLKKTIIGWGQLLDHGQFIEMANIEILAKYQGQGLGKKLVKFIIYNSPYQTIWVTTTTPKFYQKLNFEIISKRPEFMKFSDYCQANCTPEKCHVLKFEKSPLLKKATHHQKLQDKYFAVLKKNNSMISDFSAVNNVIWDFPENHYYLEIDNFIFLILFPFEYPNCCLIPPYHHLPKNIIKKLISILQNLNIKYIRSLTKIQCQYFCKQAVNPVLNRDNCDYLYKCSDFAKYPGKKFIKKRNRLNKFLKVYPNYQINNVTLKDHQRLLENFVSLQCPKNKIPKMYCSTILRTALEKNLVKGFYIESNHRVIGCLFYSELNKKTIDVHFEFINPEYDGIGQLLNNHLGKITTGQYKYINRESDLGIPGLRKSKLSYRPYRLLRKYDVLIS